MSEAEDAGTGQPDDVRWPTLLLLLAAFFAFLGGLGSLPVLAGDLSQIPGPGLGGHIIVATITLHPIAAGAALLCLLRGNLAWALVAMAVVILLDWLSYLPSFQLQGIDPAADGTGGLFTFLVLVMPPILVLAVSGLALTGTRLKLATVLAVVPTVIDVLAIVAFGVGVALYGF
jgi:hypothetical protein